MKCSCCGKALGDFTLDFSYQMPDEIWALSDEEREKRAQIDFDLCRLDKRYFIRGVAYIPLTGTDAKFGWGMWVEVPIDRFFAYMERYEQDNSHIAPFLGKAANSLPPYPETLGITMQVQLGNESQRPTLFSTDSAHLFTREQSSGISLERVHSFNHKD